jgi:hypothetical protein
MGRGGTRPYRFICFVPFVFLLLDYFAIHNFAFLTCPERFRDWRDSRNSRITLDLGPWTINLGPYIPEGGQ